MKQLIGVCLLFFTVGWAFGQNKLNYDGTIWKTSGDVQVGYIRGYIQGYSRATIDTAALVYAKPPSTMPSLSPAGKEEMLDDATKAKGRLAALASKSTLGQMETTMDTFYGDFQNTPVCWEDALLFSSASLVGNAPAEQELRAVRKADTESGCN